MIFASNADELYFGALYAVINHGAMTKPRDFNCKELSPCHLRLLNPTKNIICNPERKINEAFAAAEFLWMFYGRDDVAYLDPYNSKLKEFSDNGITFYGAYGPRLINQMPYILRILQEDPWTRQAVLTIWRENPPKTKDVPCTVMMHFIRRPVDTLNLIVYMRSQDCWLGLPYDIHNFTCIQLITADTLKLKVGNFDLIQGSLHAYENDFSKIEKLLKKSIPISRQTPTTYNEILKQKLNLMREYLKRKK